MHYFVFIFNIHSFDANEEKLWKKFDNNDKMK